MKKEIDTILRLLRAVQKIDPEFPLQYAVCLMEIALHEGLSLTALSERTGMPISTVSRTVGALSQKRQMGKPYELVKVVISARERRRKELYLTPRGHAAMQEIIGAAPADREPDERLRA